MNLILIGRTEDKCKQMSVKSIIKSIFTVLIIIILLYFVGVDRLVNSFKNINPYFILVAFLLFPLVIAIGTEKWRIIIRHEAKDVRYSDALISFLGGMTFGLLTPGRVGEFGRIAFIQSGQKSALLGIAFVDKVVDLELTLFLGVLGAYYFGWTELALIIFCCVLTGLICIFFPNMFIGLLNKIIVHFSFNDIFNNFLNAIRGIPKKVLFVCLGYRLLASFVDIIQFYLLINSFYPIFLKYVFFAYPIIILSNIFPLTIGGIGIRESLSALILHRFGIPLEVAVNASFLLFCVNTLIPGLLGAVFVPRIKLKKARASEYS